MRSAWQRNALVGLALLPLMVFGTTLAQAEKVESPADLLTWLRENVHPLESAVSIESNEDLEPLKTIVGDARIVALGEATHGTSEFFTMKHRIVQFLAEEMDFTVFSIEANMPEAYRLNEYVLTGEGDPRELLDGMYFWTWNTQEVLDMILWMREFNASGQGVMQFTGFDMQTPTVAVEEVRAFVETYDSEYLAQLDEVYRAVSSAYEMRGGQDASTEDLESWHAAAREVLNHLQSQQEVYGAEQSELAWAIQNAQIVLQGAQDSLRRVSDSWADYPSRDESMAANVEWILEQNPEAKVVLWAHNYHIKESTVRPMGGFLAKKLGDDYFSLGFVFYKGDYNAISRLERNLQVNKANPAPAESVGGVFHNVGIPFFILDLSSVSRENPSAWLTQHQEVRTTGAFALEDERDFSGTLLSITYDAVIFVDQMTPTNLLP